MEFIGSGEYGQFYNESSHPGVGKYIFLFILAFLYVQQSFTIFFIWLLHISHYVYS